MLSFVIITQTIGGQNITIYQFLGELFFLQNYLGSLNGHTWSLAVEEHFYFFLSFLIWGMLKYSPRKNKTFYAIPTVYVFIALLCLGFRVWNNFQNPVYQHHTHLFPTHLRLDALFFGVFLSYLYHFWQDELKSFFIQRRKLILITALLLISPAFILRIENIWMNTVGLTTLYIGFGGLLLYFIFCVHEEKLSYLMSPLFYFLAWVGYYSYNIYLWHLSVHYYSNRIFSKLFGTDTPILHFIIYFWGSIFLGMFVSRLLEIPCLKLRDKYYPRRII